jgi:U3 small nucleolar RNA-associated protein 12
MEARRARKRRREREKAKDKKKGEDDEMLADEIKIEDGQQDGIAGTWLERITDFCIVRAKAKIRSFSLIESESSGTLQISLQLNNNSLETWTVPAPPVESSSGSVLKKLKALAGANGVIEPVRKYTVEHSGHRADVRTLCVSSDDQVVASASNGGYQMLGVSYVLNIFSFITLHSV